MLEKIINEAKPRMQQVLEKLEEELKTIRTGRASSGLVENVLVTYYGTPTPLKQVASISIPDGSLIVIQPWDKSVMHDIETGIRGANLGFNPINDGQVIRISLPPLTQERRGEFVKSIHQKVEAARIAMRNVRKDAWEEVQKQEKVGEITEDDRYLGEERLNKLIDEYNKKVEEAGEGKEKEIMTI